MTTILADGDSNGGGFWATIAELIEANRVPLLIIIVIAVTVVVTLVLIVVIRRAAAHVVARAEARRDSGHRRRSAHDQIVRRTRTASTLAINVLIWIQVAIAIATILGILGVNLTALLASAGVLAAVLTFGAQNVIKDVLAGLFMVFEDQLDVGDVVDTGLGSGVVESVGIRVTQLRDLNGALWSIRNGEIVRVVNSSRVWHRVVLDLAFVPDVDVAEAEHVVLDAMADALAAARADDAVLDAPVCEGVVAFDGDSATLRFTTRLTVVGADRFAAPLRNAVREAIMREPGLELAKAVPA